MNMETIMAIRERKGRASPWQCYWNNPFTGKRECANFATKEEALKHDSLIKHQLRFERESFQKEEIEEDAEVLTLEKAYLLYLKKKQFTKKGIKWQLDSMRTTLRLHGESALSAIGYNELIAVMEGETQKHVRAF